MNHVPSASRHATAASAGGAADGRQGLASKSPSQKVWRPESPTRLLHSKLADAPSPCFASSSGQGRLFGSTHVPLDLSVSLSDRSLTPSTQSPRRDDPFASPPLVQEDRLVSGLAREHPRVPRLALPLGEGAAAEATAASASANRTPPAAASASAEGSLVSAMKEYWERRSGGSRGDGRSRDFDDARSIAAALQRHSRQSFEQQRPLTDALSEMVASLCGEVAGLCGEDSLLDASLADTTAVTTLGSEDGVLDSATRGLDSDGSGDEDDDAPGKDLLLLQHALEKDAELWWKSQRRLIRLIMRVAKKRRRSGVRCSCGHECSACELQCASEFKEVPKLAAQSVSPPARAQRQVQEEPASEPDAGASAVI